MPESTYNSIEQLREAFERQLSDEESGWLGSAMDEIRSSEDPQDRQLFFSSMSGRKLSADAIEGVHGLWNKVEVARLLFLTALIDRQPNNRYDIVWQSYRLGDDNEKSAYVKGLALLDTDGELLDLALYTGRTNNICLFSAIALDNIYPARHYDDRAFVQLVLKSLFMDLDIYNIDSLSQRLHPDLSTKCMELVHERLAADRNPPFSIWLAIDIRHLDEEDQKLFLAYLHSEDVEHRYYSLLAIKKLGLLDRFESHIQQRRESEKDTNVLGLLA